MKTKWIAILCLTLLLGCGKTEQEDLFYQGNLKAVNETDPRGINNTSKTATALNMGVWAPDYFKWAGDVDYDKCKSAGKTYTFSFASASTIPLNIQLLKKDGKTVLHSEVMGGQNLSFQYTPPTGDFFIKTWKSETDTCRVLRGFFIK